MKMRGFGSKRPTTSEPDDDDPSVGGGAADVQMVVLLWKNSRLLAPEAPFKVRWDKLLLLLTAYSALEFPLLWAYDIEPHAAHLVIDYLCDLFFWINLVVSARTSFLDELGMEIVTDAKVVMKRYAKSWLVIDAFAAFPLELFVGGATYMGSPTSPAAFSSLRLVRTVFRAFMVLFKPGTTLTKVRSKRLRGLAALALSTPARMHIPHSLWSPPTPCKQESKGTNTVLLRLERIGRLFVYFLFGTHWVGCIWWAIGVAELARLQTEQGVDPSTIVNYTKMDLKVNSWLERPNYKGLPLNPTMPLGARYLSGLYWAFTTLMKTSWIPGRTAWECFFAASVVFCGAILFAFILAAVSQVVTAASRTAFWLVRANP